MRAECVIVGGGISGLAAAHELQRRRIPFALVERATRSAGVLRTEHVDGFVVDAGPDALLAQKRAGIALCEELGVALSPARSTRAVIAHHGRLRAPRRRCVRHPHRLEIVRPCSRLFDCGKTPHGWGIFRPASPAGWGRIHRAGVQLDVGHLPLIARLQARVSALPGVFVSAAGIRGVGVGDCVGDARAQAIAAFAPGRDIMRVLLAVDGSACSDMAVQSVLDRFRPGDTHVNVLHAVEWMREMPLCFQYGSGPKAGHDVVGSRNKSFERARALVERVAAQLEVKGFHPSVSTPDADPRHAIVEAARAWPADLIVIGSHGRKGLDRLLIGSVAESVARHAPCSVDIVRVPVAGADLEARQSRDAARR